MEKQKEKVRIAGESIVGALLVLIGLGMLIGLSTFGFYIIWSPTFSEVEVTFFVKIVLSFSFLSIFCLSVWLLYWICVEIIRAVGFEATKLCALIFLLVVVCLAFAWNYYNTRTITLEAGDYSVVIRQRIVERMGYSEENLPRTFDELRKLQVKEIAWSELASGYGFHRWYDWTPRRGFIHRGTICPCE